MRKSGCKSNGYSPFSNNDSGENLPGGTACVDKDNNRSFMMLKETLENELSDDVEDEVFVRDRKKNFKIGSDTAKPLMAPKKKKKRMHSFLLQEPDSKCQTSRPRRFCRLSPYFLLFLVVTLMIVFSIFIWLVFYTNDTNSVKSPIYWSAPQSQLTLLERKTAIPTMPKWPSCDNVLLQTLWIRVAGTFSSITNFQPVYNQNTKTDDFYVAFGREPSLRISSYEKQVCNKQYSRKETECLGYLVVLNGLTGDKRWERWLPEAAENLICQIDINNDGHPDCVVSGKNGMLLMVDGKNGYVIWTFRQSSTVQGYMNIYSTYLAPNNNLKSCPDLVCLHTIGNSTTNMTGRVLLLNSCKGTILSEFTLSPQYGLNIAFVITPPIMMQFSDGEQMLVFVTGTIQEPGGIFGISMRHLRNKPKDSINVKMITYDEKGISAIPVLVDLNMDQFQDLLYCTSDKIVALSGTNIDHKLWTVSLKQILRTEYEITIKWITAAYLNDDDIIDVVAVMNVGYDFPSYHYGVIIMLDGKTGNLLAEPTMHSDIIALSGVIRIKNRPKRDIVLYWALSCIGNDRSQDPFVFAPLMSAEQEEIQYYADLCWLRFNSTAEIHLMGINVETGSPGELLYSINTVLSDKFENEIKSHMKNPITGIDKENNAVNKNQTDYEIPKPMQYDNKINGETILAEVQEPSEENMVEQQNSEANDIAYQNTNDVAESTQVLPSLIDSEADASNIGAGSETAKLNEKYNLLKSVLESENEQPTLDGQNEDWKEGNNENRISSEMDRKYTPNDYDTENTSTFKDRNKKASSELTSREVDGELIKDGRLQNKIGFVHDREFIKRLKSKFESLRGSPNDGTENDSDRQNLSSRNQKLTDKLIYDRQIMRKILKARNDENESKAKHRGIWLNDNYGAIDNNIYRTSAKGDDDMGQTLNMIPELKCDGKINSPKFCKERFKRAAEEVVFMPSILASAAVSGIQKGNTSVIFATSPKPYFRNVQILTGKVEECIRKTLFYSQYSHSKYVGMAADKKKNEIIKDCVTQHYGTEYYRNMIDRREKFSIPKMNVITLHRRSIICKANNE